MSQSSLEIAPALVRFTATVNGQFDELYVTDSQFGSVVSGLGRVEALLKPGIYRISQRIGQKIQSTIFEIKLGVPVDLSLAPLKYSTPIPSWEIEPRLLSGAEQARLPREGKSRLGFASNTFAFLGSPSVLGRTRADCGLSIELCAPQGPNGNVSKLAIERLEMEASRLYVTPFDGPESWSILKDGFFDRDAGRIAFARELPPGAYLLQQVQEFPYRRCMPIWVSDNLSLHGFIQVSNTSPSGLPESFAPLDLDHSAFVYMRRGDQMPGPHDPEFNLHEVARKALASRRTGVAREMLDRILESKFGFPMLGLMGVHLLLLQQQRLLRPEEISKSTRPLTKLFDSPKDMRRITTVLDRTMAMLGSEMPDVVALQAYVRRNGADADGTQQNARRLVAPPMLRASWEAFQSISPPIDGPLQGLMRDGQFRFAQTMLSTRTWLSWTEIIGARTRERRAQYESKHRGSLGASSISYSDTDFINEAVEILKSRKVQTWLDLLRGATSERSGLPNLTANARKLLSTVGAVQNSLVGPVDYKSVAGTVLRDLNFAEKVTAESLKAISRGIKTIESREQLSRQR